MKKILIFLKLIRIKHYIKNLLIFFPLLFSGLLLTKNLFQSVLGFISFSLMASVVYVINDIKDIDNDRKHNTKKNRPIASGEISVKEALIIACILFALSLLISYISGFSFIVNALLIIYLLLNILYSYKIKNIVIIDVFFLVLFYIIRIYYGAEIIDVRVSNWLYLTIMSAAFFFSLGKRKNEIINSKKTREVLSNYTKDFLDRFMYLCLCLTIVFYSLWAIDIHIQYIVISIPLLLIIFMKYSLDLETSNEGDPTEVLFNDKLLICLVGMYTFLIVYLMVR